jgi:hypothetical protein
MENEWLIKLRRTEEALARFYVAHRKTGCQGEGCELCREFVEGMKGGLNLYRSGAKPGDPLIPHPLTWMKILEDAGYAHTHVTCSCPPPSLALPCGN